MKLIRSAVMILYLRFDRIMLNAFLQPQCGCKSYSGRVLNGQNLLNFTLTGKRDFVSYSLHILHNSNKIQPLVTSSSLTPRANTFPVSRTARPLGQRPLILKASGNNAEQNHVFKFEEPRRESKSITLLWCSWQSWSIKGFNKPVGKKKKEVGIPRIPW